MIGDFRGLIGQKLEDDRTIIAAWAETGTLYLVVRKDIKFYESWVKVEVVPEGCAIGFKLPEVASDVTDPYRKEAG